MDVNFSIEMLYPTPIARAFKTLALTQGWNPECLGACIVSNITFLEHHGTRLVRNSNDPNKISPNVPVLIGAPCASRGSTLIKFTTDLLVTDDCPNEGIATRAVFLVDATLKWIRSSLVNYMRCSVTSDEIW